MMFSLALSLALLGLFGANLFMAFRSMHRFADERGLRGFVSALMLFAGAVGLALGAYALRYAPPESVLQIITFLIGMSRAVLLIGGIFLLLTWRTRR